MERRSRSWAVGLSLIGFFTLLFSLGFVQQAKADDVAEYGTVIGIVSPPALDKHQCLQG
jgi:heat shock protein 5